MRSVPVMKDWSTVMLLRVQSAFAVALGNPYPTFLGHVHRLDRVQEYYTCLPSSPFSYALCIW